MCCLTGHRAHPRLFLDGVDSIMSQRDQGGGQRASRRMSELLIQMDGLARSDDLVFVLAASNNALGAGQGHAAALGEESGSFLGPGQEDV